MNWKIFFLLLGQICGGSTIYNLSFSCLLSNKPVLVIDSIVPFCLLYMAKVNNYLFTNLLHIIRVTN